MSAPAPGSLDEVALNDALTLRDGPDESLTVDVGPFHCVGAIGRQVLFGGMASGLSVRAIEQRIGASPRWLTIQFVAPSPLGTTLSFSVERLFGKKLSQVSFRAKIGQQTVLAGLAAVGGAPGAPDIQAAVMPDAPAPQDCPLIHAHAHADQDAHRHFEMRLIRGRFGIFSKTEVSDDGRVLVWMRPRTGAPDVAALAMMADFIPSTSSNAVSARAGGSSLDHTFRLVQMKPTDWVLCEFRIDAIHDGVGHGTANLFANDGTLLAAGSQSYLIRILPMPSAPGSVKQHE